MHTYKRGTDPQILLIDGRPSNAALRPRLQSSFIASAFSLLQEVLEAPPAAPVYIIVNEVAAHSWGYDGRTQLSRRPKAPLQPA